MWCSLRSAELQVWPAITGSPLKRLLAALGLPVVLVLGRPDPLRAEAWKSCWFNDQPMGCRDQHHSDGGVTIRWRDGLAMTYRLVRAGFPRSSLQDSLGGLWEREVLVQGNAVLTHSNNGNRIMVPLRAEAEVGCPAAVRAQVDGLYRWHVAQQERAGAITIASQRERFTPQLFALLQRAYALTPNDGRFIDFDPFSGTQVNTVAARLEDCRQEQPARLWAQVAVQAGLRGRTAEPPQQLRFVFQHLPTEGWRIADIVYLHAPSFRLSTYLRNLVEEQR